MRLAITIFTFFLLFFTNSHVFAHGNIDPEIEKQQIEQYVLPYPGMLPDNPLYFVKSFRDKLILLLISDPLKESEYYLLQSDKYLSSAVYLQKEKKDFSFILESLKLREESINKAIENMQAIEKKDSDYLSLLSKINIASHKHKEIIVEIKTKAEKQNKIEIDRYLKSSEKILEKVNKKISD